MKNKWLYILFGLLIMFSSCIKDEAPNVEADIEDITIPDMSSVLNVKIDQNRVSVFLKEGMVDRTNIEPSFTLSPGATIAPVNTGKLDFTKPQKYIVTSEEKHILSYFLKQKFRLFTILNIGRLISGKRFMSIV